MGPTHEHLRASEPEPVESDTMAGTPAPHIYPFASHVVDDPTHNHVVVATVMSDGDVVATYVPRNEPDRTTVYLGPDVEFLESCLAEWFNIEIGLHGGRTNRARITRREIAYALEHAIRTGHVVGAEEPGTTGTPRHMAQVFVYDEHIEPGHAFVVDRATLEEMVRRHGQTSGTQPGTASSPPR